MKEHNGKAVNVATNMDVLAVSDLNGGTVEDHGTAQSPELASELQMKLLHPGSSYTDTLSRVSNESHTKKISTVTKFKIIKNFTILCTTFLLLSSAFQVLLNLQSTINRAEGLGTTSLAMTYLTSILAGLFLTPALIASLGCKWTMVLGGSFYDCYIGANIYPTWATILPASTLMGVGVSSLFTAEMAYVNQLGTWYSQLTGQAEDAVMSTLAGIFISVLMSSVVFGNLFSSLYLKRDPLSNSTDHDISSCGADFCPYIETNGSSIPDVDAKQIQTLSGICLAVGCFSLVIMALLMDPLRTDSGQKGALFSTKKLLTTLKHLQHSRYQKLLLLVSMYRGIGTAFIIGDFTVAMVSCPYGVESVGFVLVAYGASSTVFSLVWGHVVKYIGQRALFVIVWVTESSVLITLLAWKPVHDGIYVVYILAAVWAIGDPAYRSTVFTVYAGIFTEDKPAAFSTHMCLEGIGFASAFAYSAYLCTRVKIGIVLAFLTAATVLVLTVITLVRRSNTTRTDQTE